MSSEKYIVFKEMFEPIYVEKEEFFDVEVRIIDTRLNVKSDFISHIFDADGHSNFGLCKFFGAKCARKIFLEELMKLKDVKVEIDKDDYKYAKINGEYINVRFVEEISKLITTFIGSLEACEKREKELTELIKRHIKLQYNAITKKEIKIKPILDNLRNIKTIFGRITVRIKSQRDFEMAIDMMVKLISDLEERILRAKK